MQPMQPMAGYGAPPYQGAAAPPTYEFSELENQTIGSVARYTRMWGIISLCSGVLLLVCGVIVALAAGTLAAANTGRHHSSSGLLASPAALGAIGIALIPSAIVSIIGGVFYLKSGAALRAVVDTQGDDIRLLTDAIRSLSTALKIEAITMAVAFVIGLIIGLVARAGGHS
jgi:hypothetical protein